jgi:hypothetical protein
VQNVLQGCFPEGSQSSPPGSTEPHTCAITRFSHTYPRYAYVPAGGLLSSHTLFSHFIFTFYCPHFPQHNRLNSLEDLAGLSSLKFLAASHNMLSEVSVFLATSHNMLSEVNVRGNIEIESGVKKVQGGREGGREGEREGGREVGILSPRHTNPSRAS